MPRSLVSRGAAALLALAALSAGAADIGTGGDALAPAREFIATKRFDEALVSLREIDDTGSADWQNLMGYTLRRSKTPDLAGAQKHYDAALRIDPNHRGALQYSGELALMKGKLPVAEERLQRLGKACRSTCDEYLNLADAVKRFKATGKYVGW
jgi:tetratricopeptide (TPR) repeat protein